MTTVPITAARQALNDTEAALARLRPALAAAYGTAGENLTRAAGQLDAAERRAERAEADMKEIAEAYDRHRRTLAAVFARSAEISFEEITEYAAKTLTRSGERLLDAEERLAAAEQFAIRLAAAEKARAEAERVAERATNTLLRIKHARTAADAWTALGTHYHLSPTEAGRRARNWRSTAERDAAKRAETASALGARHMGDSERFHAAWHSARLRAQQTASELRVTRASRRRWKRRTKTAEQALADIRTPQPISRDHPMYALLAAMVGPGIGQAEARQHLTDYYNAITGRKQ
ncbi:MULTISPECIES: hypothetical protein [unclassified Streptomyces]|uniref:hypothetical protein n=1 Tax=Streptomyces sp. NPDC055082 TaxID=3365718 RepID=UPI0037D13A5E